MAPFSYLADALVHYQHGWASGRYNYTSFDPSEEATTLTIYRDFLDKYPRAYTRSDLPGHFTGSALVVNPQLTKVILTHHRKLNLWLQLGGHADGDPRLYSVAEREAIEESGLNKVEFAPFAACWANFNGESTPLPFDLDRHLIPARKDEPEHYHFDVRYIFIADDQAAIQVSEESHNVMWFTLEDALRVNPERSMERQFAKLQWIKEQSLKI